MKLSPKGVGLVLLGVLGIVFDVSGLLSFLPDYVAKAIEALQFLLGIMGVREIMLDSKASILAVVADWRSQTFWGGLLTFLLPLFLNPEQLPNLPVAVEYAFQVVGGFLIALGWSDAGKRGVFAK